MRSEKVQGLSDSGKKSKISSECSKRLKLITDWDSALCSLPFPDHKKDDSGRNHKAAEKLPHGYGAE